jgi:hypothetical protein
MSMDREPRAASCRSTRSDVRFTAIDNSQTRELLVVLHF